MIDCSRVPAGLVQDILEGRCIAFVGAGFSAKAVPTWKQLLETLANNPAATDLDEAIKKASTAFDYEALGQILRDRFKSEEVFEAKVKEVLCANPVPDNLKNRVRLLSEIPFDAILTTNYDQSLPGAPPSPETFRQILRRPRRWWEREQWELEPGATPAPRNVIKLHGDANGDPELNPIVLGRGDYRRLVHQSPHYAPFLRAVFATRTVLFLGVSFTDAYLNELRSEVVAMLQPEGDKIVPLPLAYAIVNDRSGAWEDYFLRHEGIQLLNFGTGGGENFSGFDDWLSAIHLQTAPAERLRSLLRDKFIVWVDDNPGNAYGRKVFEGAKCRIQQLRSPAEFTDAHLQADLILTRFGYRSGSSSVAFDVLEHLSGKGSRPPVIVFASGDEATRNRREALRRGAFEYASTWGELFGLIEQLFGRTVGYGG